MPRPGEYRRVIAETDPPPPAIDIDLKRHSERAGYLKALAGMFSALVVVGWLAAKAWSDVASKPELNKVAADNLTTSRTLETHVAELAARTAIVESAQAHQDQQLGRIEGKLDRLIEGRYGAKWTPMGPTTLQQSATSRDGGR